MSQKSPTAQARELIIEFLKQSQNQNRVVAKKEIETYVESNWVNEQDLTPGTLSGALYDLVHAEKIVNPSRGNYALSDQPTKNTADLRAEIRSALTESIENIERIVEGIEFELQEPDANQIRELFDTLSSYRSKFLFPAK